MWGKRGVAKRDTKICITRKGNLKRRKQVITTVDGYILNVESPFDAICQVAAAAETFFAESSGFLGLEYSENSWLKTGHTRCAEKNEE